MNEYELARELKEKIAVRLHQRGGPRTVVKDEDLWELARDIAEMQVTVQTLLRALPPQVPNPRLAGEEPPF